MASYMLMQFCSVKIDTNTSALSAPAACIADCDLRGAWRWSGTNTVFTCDAGLLEDRAS